MAVFSASEHQIGISVWYYMHDSKLIHNLTLKKWFWTPWDTGWRYSYNLTYVRKSLFKIYQMVNERSIIILQYLGSINVKNSSYIWIWKKFAISGTNLLNGPWFSFFIVRISSFRGSLFMGELTWEKPNFCRDQWNCSLLWEFCYSRSCFSGFRLLWPKMTENC